MVLRFAHMSKRYKEGMTFKQIAEIKEISPQYAHRRISKIVRKMKEWRFIYKDIVNNWEA